jgi:hypothetical protein
MAGDKAQWQNILLKCAGALNSVPQKIITLKKHICVLTYLFI